MSPPAPITAMRSFLMMLPLGQICSFVGRWSFLILPAYHPVPHDQQIHPGAEKAGQSVLRSTDDRLILVEGRIQHDRDSSLFLKSLDQGVVAWVLRARYGLEPAGVIHMVDGAHGISDF